MLHSDADDGREPWRAAQAEACAPLKARRHSCTLLLDWNEPRYGRHRLDGTTATTLPSTPGPFVRIGRFPIAARDHMLKNRLKEILAKEGVTQVELARKAGLSVATVSKVAKKQHSVLDSTKKRIVQALNNLTGNNYRISDVFPPPSRRRAETAPPASRHVEITIDKSYEEFSEADERELLEYIRKATGDYGAKIVSKTGLQISCLQI